MSHSSSRVRDLSGNSLSAAPAAILIVHGGNPNPHIRWLSFCLQRIAHVTPSADHHLFIWNDRPADIWVPELNAGLNNCTLLTRSPEDRSVFPDKSFLHADRLQRLYERARAAGYRVIVTMDTDAHPLRVGWLDVLRGALADGAALAGAWHDEQRDEIEPYVHPCCLATTVDFVERYRLRFDEIGEAPHGRRRGTLEHFTMCALRNHHEVFRLRRSNRNQFHPIIGAVYGDLIYHHGGGSRRKVRYSGQLGLDEESIVSQNQTLSERAAQALVQDYDCYMSWLTYRGTTGSPTPRPSLVLVLGMHRSGTSCLTGALEACGGDLGDVDRSSPFNPGGNLELPAVTRLNDRILADDGGAWDHPPTPVRVQPWHQDVVSDLLISFRKQGISIVKDPRMLLVAHAWLPVAGVCSIIGTFRHPLAVARSLARRNGMSREKALHLWSAYNSRLMQLHEQLRFPLIEYQLDSRARYREELERLISLLGFQIDRPALDGWIKPPDHTVDPVEEQVPKHCRAVFEYLRHHSIGVASSLAASAQPSEPLIFAPGGEVLHSSSFRVLRRLVYQCLYRLSLVYHHLPHPFRARVREILGSIYARRKRRQPPSGDPRLKVWTQSPPCPAAAPKDRTGSIRDPEEAA